VTAQPELSIVVPTDRYATIAEVMSHLRRQTIAEQVEVVIVAPSEDAVGISEAERKGLHSIQVLSVGDLRSLPRARAAGIRAATAPIVAIGETHSYPDPDWAEALVEAHKGPWSVVGPRLSNANPETLRSWVGILLDYGEFLDTTRRGESRFLPGHNSSFKRDALLGYGDDLDRMLFSDTELTEDLRRRGHRLFLESRARTNHLQVDKPVSWVIERFVAGWSVAAGRSQSWSPARRAAYAAGSPLIPFVRFRRIMRALTESGHASELLPRVLPSLGVALVLSACGELFGYALGQGPTRRLYQYELRRIDYVRRPRSGQVVASDEVILPEGRAV
jgi:glycosyl transferase family 2